MLSSFSKPLFVPFVLIVILSIRLLVLTPPRKMVSLSGNIASSLISLARYRLRYISHLIFGMMPSLLPHISRIGSPPLPMVALFPFTISYPPPLSSPFLLGSLDVLPLSKITLLPCPKSPLVLYKAYLLATLLHRRAIRFTFLKPVVT